MEIQAVDTKVKWNIDHRHSFIGFSVKHMMFTNVRGNFTEFDASIYTTGNDFLTAEIDLWINAAAIDTHNKQRDAHLRSADFLMVEKFKEINFSGNTIENQNNDQHYDLYGELTIHGKKKQVRLDVEFGGILKEPMGIQRAFFKVTGKINRKDWGLHWNALLETGGVLVGLDVSIECELQLIKAEA